MTGLLHINYPIFVEKSRPLVHSGLNTMQLNLEKFTVTRKGFPADQAGMAYLLQPVRRELKERARLVQRTLESVLILDFEPDCLAFPEAAQVEYSSLFDTGPSNRQATFPTITLSRAGTLFDCVVSNLQGTWFEFGAFTGQVKQVLKPGGAFCFSAFGPGTLAEIDHAWKQVDSGPHVHPFTDMHDLGDTLLKTGFEKPVVDTDRVQVEYADCMTVISDLRGEGFVNLHAGRRKSLTGKQRFRQFQRHVAKQTKRGKITITFEIIYGYAQKPRMQGGQVFVNPPAAVSR